MSVTQAHRCCDTVRSARKEHSDKMAILTMAVAVGIKIDRKSSVDIVVEYILVVYDGGKDFQQV